MLTSPWPDYLMAFVSALFLVNGIPHFVHGVSGRKFPTPFSGGAGTLDGPVRNVFWGAANLVVGGWLLWAIRASLTDPAIVAELAITGTAGGAFLGWAFGPDRAARRKKD